MAPFRRRVASRRQCLFAEQLESRLLLHAGPNGVEAPDTEPALEAFESTEQFEQYVLEQSLDRYDGLFGQPGYGGGYYPRSLDWFQLDAGQAVPREGLLEAFAAGNFQASGASDSTNVQVAGVDEGDLVETDGRYLYVLSQGRLNIIDTDDEQLSFVSSVEIDGAALQQFLVEDRLAILSNSYDGFELTVWDVSDPSAVTLVESNQFDGRLVDARVIGDSVYVVTNNYFQLPPPQLECPDGVHDRLPVPEPIAAPDFEAWPTLVMLPGIWRPQHEDCIYETREEYLERYEGQVLESAVPTITTQFGDAEAQDMLLVDGTNVHQVNHYESTAFATIMVFDVHDDAAGPIDSSSAEVASNYSNNIYVSTEAAYIPSTVRETTTIVKFDLQGGDVSAAAVGQVPGYIQGQFSMDEHEGLLRVTTSEFREGNNLFVLEQHEDRLETIGAVEDLAPGERIFATRFFDHQAFMVTFRLVDPLFSIDLSDPANPEVLGELKIPGFSNYLHPVGNDLLVGIGRDGDGFFRGNPQVSLFDVSDLNEPTRTDTFTVEIDGFTPPAVSSDHHAFSYFPDQGILAVPVNSILFDATLPEGESRVTPRLQNRLYVLQVNPGEDSSIESLGTVEHEHAIRRSLVLGDTLYVISSQQITAHPLLDPATTLADLRYGRIAHPDRLDVLRNDGQQKLDVLANDEGANDLKIVEVSAGDAAAVIEIAEDGRSIVYTPAPGYNHDRFTYTVENGGGVRDTTRVDVSLRFEVLEDSIDNSLPVLGSRTFGESGEPVIAEAHSDFGEVAISDDGQELRFTPRADFFGRTLVKYTVSLETDGGVVESHSETVWVSVENVNDNPKAVDDEFVVAAGEDFFAYVTSNDSFQPDPYERLLVSEVSDPENGRVSIRANGGIRYTPDIGYVGTDEFTYTIVDGNGGFAQATVHLRVVEEPTEPPIEGDPLVEFTLVPANQNGDAIEQVGVGEKWWLDVYASDLRPFGEGVFAGYVDIEFENAAVAGEIKFADTFSNVRADSDTEGQIDDVGAVADFKPTGLGEQLLFRVPMTAEQVGEVVLESNRADDIPAHEVLLFGLNSAISSQLIVYGGATLEVTEQTSDPVVDPDEPAVQPIVEFRLMATDEGGAELTQVEVGETFYVSALASDVRNFPSGVFAGFVDVEFSNVSVGGEVEFGEHYSNAQAQTATPGQLDDVGGASSLDPLGQGEYEVFRVAMMAGELGELKLTTNPADNLPTTEVLVYGLDTAVDEAAIVYGGLTLEVVENEFHNKDNPLDVNHDGSISPADALVVIDTMNHSGTGSLSDDAIAPYGGDVEGGDVEGEPRRRLYIDVNGDRHLSSHDALRIINFLNDLPVSSGEGELAERSSREEVDSDLLEAKPIEPASSDAAFGSIGPAAVSVFADLGEPQDEQVEGAIASSAAVDYSSQDAPETLVPNPSKDEIDIVELESLDELFAVLGENDRV